MSSESFKVLIIDDEKEFVEGLAWKAEKKGLKLVHAQNLDDGKELIEKNPSTFFSGIILDGKGFPKRGDTVADKKFVGLSLREFSRAKSKAASLPKIVLTGFNEIYDEIRDLDIVSPEDCFLKGRGEEKALERIKYLATESEPNKIRDQNPQVFSIFEKGFLDLEVEDKLISVILDMANENPKSVENNLTSLRNLQEDIYKALNKNFGDKIIPTRFMMSKGFKTRVDIPGIYKYLSGIHKDYDSIDFVKQYSIIHQLAKINYDIASEYGDHSYEKGPNIYPPTQYTVQVCTNAILDLLLWFKSIMEERT